MKVLRWIQNLSLYMKILLVTIMVCLIMLIGNFLILRLIVQTYNEQLYVRTAQVFTAYVNQIETEFEKLDTVTFTLQGDSGIQRNLMLLREEKAGSIDWLTAKNALRNQLNSYLYNMDVFNSFGIYTSESQLAGLEKEIPAEDKEKLVAEAKEKSGASKIVLYKEEIYFLRQIRQAKDLTLSDLGTMIGVIDVNRILNECGERYQEAGIGMNLSVYIEDSCIYTDGVSVQTLKDDGWQIQDNKFVVQCTTGRGWRFLLHTPYDDITSSTRETIAKSIMLMVIIALAALLISYYWVIRINSQIDELMCKFDDYGKGILPEEKDIHKYTERKDEIGRLHKHFDRMVYEYKNLNDDYYRRILLQKEAQYKQLQQQIQPHFIFNTLSLIMWVAYEHKDNEIAELTSALSRLLRKSISFNEKAITVEEELKMVNDYMLIQDKRFGSRLIFEVDVSEMCAKALIPQMTIQPIVENAVKYVLEAILETAIIKIVGRIEGETAVIIVEDNGPGIEEDILKKLSSGQIKANGNGIGLWNIQQRIHILYSEKYGLEFQREGDRTQVWIKVPYKFEMGEEENV